MSKTTHLFQLIQSLNANEKRYFKLFANLQKGNKHYIDLFDAIAKQKEYNETALKKHFADSLSAQKFSAAKAYLEEQIIKALSNIATYKGTKNLLHEEMLAINLLAEKRLHSHAEIRIDKLKQKAYEHEQFEVVIEIIALQMSLITQTLIGNYATDYLTVINERETALEKYHNALTFRNLYQKMIYFITITGQARGNKDEQQPQTAQTHINQIIQHPLLKHEDNALSKRAKLDFNNCWYAYHYYYTQYEQSLFFKEKGLAIWDSFIAYKNDNMDMYLSYLANLNALQNHLKHYHQTLIYLQKMKLIAAQYPQYDLFVFQNYYGSALVAYAGLFDVETPLAFVPAIEQGLAVHKDKINKVRYIDLCFNVSVLFFKVGRFSEASDWLNRILYNDDDIREDVQCLLRIYNLVVQYELQNWLWMESLLRNYHRYLQKRQQLFDFEQIMLRFFRKAIDAPNKKAQQTLFAELLPQLQNLINKPTEQQHLRNFTFIVWVESKLKKQSFLETWQNQTE
jgi:hypothetical protein